MYSRSVGSSRWEIMAKKASFTVQSSEKVNHINGWLTMPRRQGQCQKMPEASWRKLWMPKGIFISIGIIFPQVWVSVWGTSHTGLLHNTWWFKKTLNWFFFNHRLIRLQSVKEYHMSYGHLTTVCISTWWVWLQKYEGSLIPQ